MRSRRGAQSNRGGTDDLCRCCAGERCRCTTTRLARWPVAASRSSARRSWWTPLRRSTRMTSSAACSRSENVQRTSYQSPAEGFTFAPCRTPSSFTRASSRPINYGRISQTYKYTIICFTFFSPGRGREF